MPALEQRPKRQSVKIPGVHYLWSLSVAFIIQFFLHLPALAEPVYKRTDQSDQVDELFAQWDRPGSPGAAIGIFKAGRIIYARGYGMANLEHDIPNSPQTVFRIGSTSKHFTAMGIAILIEQGKIAADDDIRRYLPELPVYKPAIKIRHMLYHTSGLRNYEALTTLAGIDGETYKVPYYTDADVIRLISRQKSLQFPPGEQYAYSNTNYFLLAEIIARVSGMKTAAFADRYLFEPLDMHNTHFHDDVNIIVRNRASGYSPAGDGSFRINMTQLEQIGTGSIYTTVEDFFKWDQNFYRNKLGKGTQGLIEMMQKSGSLNDGRLTHYGFGLDINTHFGLRSIGHGGAFVGYRSYYLRFPDQHFSVVLMSNLGPFPSYELVQKIARIYLGAIKAEIAAMPVVVHRSEEGEDAVNPAAITLSDRQNQQYTGRYYSEELDAFYTIEIRQGGLVVQVGKYYRTEMTPAGNDEFLWDLGKFNFIRNAAGEVSGFNLHSGSIRNIYFVRLEPGL